MSGKLLLLPIMPGPSSTSSSSANLYVELQGGNGWECCVIMIMLFQGAGHSASFPFTRYTCLRTVAISHGGIEARVCAVIESQRRNVRQTDLLAATKTYVPSRALSSSESSIWMQVGDHIHAGQYVRK